MKNIGKKTWAIPEGYLPEYSTGPEPEMKSHGTFCVLNPNPEPAHLRVTIYFEERDPAGPYEFFIPALRTKHIRFNSLEDPEKIPLGMDFASLIESDIPVVVQHTRLDSRQEANALMTTMAFPGDE